MRYRPEDFDIIDSGYASGKDDFNAIKEHWKEKNPQAKVMRVKTDTKGLIMYWIIVLKV